MGPHVNANLGSLNIHGTHVNANIGCFYIHGTHVNANKSTNINVVFFFISDLKIINYNYKSLITMS